MPTFLLEENTEHTYFFKLQTKKEQASAPLIKLKITQINYLKFLLPTFLLEENTEHTYFFKLQIKKEQASAPLIKLKITQTNYLKFLLPTFLFKEKYGQRKVSQRISMSTGSVKLSPGERRRIPFLFSSSSVG